MTYRSPATGTPFVYVAFNGSVVALHRETGQRAWTAKVGGWHARIIVEGGRVFVLGAELACFDAKTGARLWTSEGVYGADTLLVNGDQLFVAGRGEITCVSTADGTRLWHDGFEGMGLGGVSVAVEGSASQMDLTG